MVLPALLIATIGLLPTLAFAQADSTFTLMRNGIEARFPFTKWEKLERFKSVSLPVYSFNQLQFNRVKGLLISFAQMEQDYQLLLSNYHEKENFMAAKEKALLDKASLEQERAKNFETSYNQLLTMNAQLNDQLEKTELLAVHEHRKRKVKSVVIGLLAFSAGAVIGVTIR